MIGLQVRPYWSSKIRAPSPKNVTPPIHMASIAKTPMVAQPMTYIFLRPMRSEM